MALPQIRSAAEPVGRHLKRAKPHCPVPGSAIEKTSHTLATAPLLAIEKFRRFGQLVGIEWPLWVESRHSNSVAVAKGDMQRIYPRKLTTPRYLSVRMLDGRNGAILRAKP
jgi:hypothetical protein